MKVASRPPQAVHDFSKSRGIDAFFEEVRDRSSLHEGIERENEATVDRLVVRVNERTLAPKPSPESSWWDAKQAADVLGREPAGHPDVSPVAELVH